MKMASTTISINRAPVLTLWAAVVAQRLGFAEDEALTLGKAVAGLNAQAKGRAVLDRGLGSDALSLRESGGDFTSSPPNFGYRPQRKSLSVMIFVLARERTQR